VADDATTDPALRSWVPGADDSGFPVQHLPYGTFSVGGDHPRAGVAIGDQIVDLEVAARAKLFDAVLHDPVATFRGPDLSPFLALGPAAWQRVRAELSDLLRADSPRSRPMGDALVAQADATLHLPFAVADYVDFYSSLEHATNLGRLFRPDGDPLLPNWRHLPVGYHGRAGTVVVSGTPVVRPAGQAGGPDGPVFGPSRRLDIELEVGFVVGTPSRLGRPVPAAAVRDHVFGAVLVNDWSARDIQAWEYQPLGPFLGKSFATSISPWVTPLAALEPFRVDARPQEPPVLPYLRVDEPWALDLHLEIGLRSAAMAAAGTPFDVVSRPDFARLYWTLPQQLAHLTVNGASLRSGDLLASGTVSGDRGDEGSLLERTLGGREPLRLSDGSERTFLLDGDEVVLRGSAGGGGRPRLTLAEVTGTILPNPG